MWRRWFAWHPVTTESGLVWWKPVERRSRFSPGGPWGYNEIWYEHRDVDHTN